MRIAPVALLLVACQDYDVHRIKDFDSFVQGEPVSSSASNALGVTTCACGTSSSR